MESRGLKDPFAADSAPGGQVPLTGFRFQFW